MSVKDSLVSLTLIARPPSLPYLNFLLSDFLISNRFLPPLHVHIWSISRETSPFFFSPVRFWMYNGVPTYYLTNHPSPKSFAASTCDERTALGDSRRSPSPPSHQYTHAISNTTWKLPVPPLVPSRPYYSLNNSAKDGQVCPPLRLCRSFFPGIFFFFPSMSKSYHSQLLWNRKFNNPENPAFAPK